MSNSRSRVATLAVLILTTVASLSAIREPQAVRADSSPTPTATASVVPEVSPEPTATATPTPTATATPRTVPAVKPRLVPTRETRRRKHRLKGRPAVTTTVRTATPTPHPARERSRHTGLKKRRRHAVRLTPTPTATATPEINLNADDSVSPVTCNGPPVSPARRPFLDSPYRGWTAIVSYFDHDSPNYVTDGIVTIATGQQAAPDRVHTRSDFPAYWDAGLRQYLFYDGHNGYDFNISYQPVFAAAAGKVIFAAFEYPTMPDHGYGKMVMIEHRGGYVTLYGHFSKILVKVGQKVRQGQRIGTSGNTGHSTGPHLHFTVFHNCTPTDPYGWTGAGPDPLASYQGESSEYLWRRAPLVVNPAPNWPKLDLAPAPPTERIVLLRLPSTAAGTAAFTAALHREALAARDRLAGPGISVKLDLLRGALLVTGPANPASIYAIPSVASISSPDTIIGAKFDLLSALARASLVTRHRRLVLSRAHNLTGYLLRWQGRTLLVARGARGARVDLRLSSGRGGDVVRGSTDPRTGAYAVDLGPLSNAQYRALNRELATRTRTRTPVVVVAPRVKQAVPAPASPPSGSLYLLFWLLLVTVGTAAAAAWMWKRASSHS